MRYSKKEGIGYLSPFGAADDGSADLVSMKVFLPVNGIVGFPAIGLDSKEDALFIIFIFSI
jgi:hypothetical protein